MVRAVIFDMFETLITHYANPVYFGNQMADDAGISREQFRNLWRPTEPERTKGTVRLEAVLEDILRKEGRYTEERLQMILEKRIRSKEECFLHLHPEIIPMMEALQKRGVKIGLISNCFSEEAEVIRKSNLFSYFDAVMLSYEQGVAKPDHEIYVRCMNALNVLPAECVYVGDGGSRELETARELGMKAVQAAWYWKDGFGHPMKRREEFSPEENPLNILNYL